MKCKPHYHFIDLPNGRRVRTNKDCHDDEELGSLLGTLGGLVGAGVGSLIAPGAGTAIGGMLGSALGGAAGGKKKKKKASVPAELQQAGFDITPIEKSIDELEDSVNTIKTLLATVPDEVKNQVMEAMKNASLQQSAEKRATNDNIDKIVSSVTSSYAPQMNAVLKLLKLNKLQQQATQEHKAIVHKDNSAKVQHAILNKISKVNSKVDSLHSSLAKTNASLSRTAANLAKARTAATLFGVPTRLL